MEVKFTNIDNYLKDKTPADRYLTEVSLKGFIFQHLQLSIYDQEKVMPIADTLLTQFLKDLKPELKMVVETDYVDKVYRDSYYSYFSTKLKDYGRSCIRISFFEPIFNTKEEFFKLSNLEVQEAYRGFLVVRPLAKCIGRNAIDIRAKKGPVNNCCIREANIASTCMGIKLKVRAFPHASQDEEYMTCAETTVWSMMEYYGNKYPIHNPMLPTDILTSVKPSSYKRQIPSTGLRLEQISLALQQQGFGCMIYERSNPRFKELFTCYLESGLPMAVVVEGTWGKHAIVCVGRPPIERSVMPHISKAINTDYVFWNQNEDTFVFNDDNTPCYQIRKFNNPTPYFGDSRISHFIVPLHKKIYLPAEQAIDKSNFFIEKDFNAPAGSYVRTFLTSSRTYRQYVKDNSDFTDDIKEAYLTVNLPKFIWVTEVSFNHTNFLSKKVNALIILDATGVTNEMDIYSSLILKQNGHHITIFDSKSRLLVNNILTMLPLDFESFQGNL